MKFISFNGRGDGEYNNVGFVEIAKRFAIQNVFYFGTKPFDSVEWPNLPSVPPL